MLRKHRAAQIYGYVVCIIAVITFIVALSNLIGAVLDSGDPLHSGYQDLSHLSSFENFKVESMKVITKDAAYIPDDAALQGMFDSAREEALAHARHGISKNLTVSGLLLLLSVVLFIIHWLMVRRLQRLPETEDASSEKPLPT